MKGKPAGDGLAVMVPSSLTADCGGLREKTLKLGQVARAAGVYRVDEVFVYRDPAHDDTGLIDKVLRYAECPPYLKRRLFPRQEELKYAGAIPPLQTPNHAVSEEPVEGEYREGIVLDRGGVEGGGTRVDVGFDSPALLLGRAPGRGRRITVETISQEPLEVARVHPDDVPQWGYSVETGTPREAEERYRGFGLEIIGTSRRGRDVRQVDLPRGSALVFGSPLGGVEGLPLRFDETVNTVPAQGTATVRTEEALNASLAVINLVRAQEEDGYWPERKDPEKGH